MKRLLTVFLVICLAVVVYAGGRHTYSRKTITNTVAASGASSAVTATVVGFPMHDYSSLTGAIIVNPSVTTLRGYGLADTCTIVIKSSLFSDAVSVDSTWKAGLPCTSFVALPENDTLFMGDMYVYIRIADSSADSTFTADHEVIWDLTARE